MRAAQAMAGMSPSLIGMLGANPYGYMSKAMLDLGNSMEDSGYKKAKLKLEQDNADAKKTYFEGKIDNQAAQITALNEKLAAKQEDAAAQREANISAIKASNPSFANSFVMSAAKDGSYLDPTKQAGLEKGMGYVKMSDVKAAEPKLITNQKGEGAWAYPDGVTKPANTTIYRAPVFSPMDYTTAKLSFEEAKPTVKDKAEKKAQLSTAMKKLGLNIADYSPIANAEMSGYKEAEKKAAGISFYPGIGYLKKVK